MPAMLDWMTGLLHRLAWLGRALTPRPGPRPLEILQADELRLVIQGRGGPLCVDRRRRAVTRNGRLLVAFDAVIQVAVRHHRGDDDSPERWSVDLHVKGWFSDIHVGSSVDDADASIAAARIATFMGRPVKAW